MVSLVTFVIPFSLVLFPVLFILPFTRFCVRLARVPVLLPASMKALIFDCVVRVGYVEYAFTIQDAKATLSASFVGIDPEENTSFGLNPISSAFFCP